MRWSSPFICGSMIWVVVFWSVWAWAPGKTAVTEICGGARGGNWATDSEVIDSNPARISARAITHAKIGRSMKKRDMSASGSVGGDAGVHLRAGMKVEQTDDDQLVAGFQTIGDDPLVADRLTGLDHPLRHDVARPEH